MVRRRALESDGPGARFQLLRVTWKRSPNLAGPQFSYLENGNNCVCLAERKGFNKGT